MKLLDSLLTAVWFHMPLAFEAVGVPGKSDNVTQSVPACQAISAETSQALLTVRLMALQRAKKRRGWSLGLLSARPTPSYNLVSENRGADSVKCLVP